MFAVIVIGRTGLRGIGKTPFRDPARLATRTAAKRKRVADVLGPRSSRSAAAGVNVHAITIGSFIQTVFLEKIGKGGRLNGIYSPPVGINEGDIGQARRYDLCLGAVLGFHQFCFDDT